MTSSRLDQGPSGLRDNGPLRWLRGIDRGYRLGAALFVLAVLASVAYNYQSSTWGGAGPAASQPGSTQTIPQSNGVNLIRSHEDFADGGWQTEGAKLDAGATVALVGSTEAGLLTETGAPGAHRILDTISGLTPGAVHTFSVFVKSGRRSALMLEARDATPNKSYGRVEFDLNRGAVTYRTRDVVDAGFVPLAGGWYRCWMSLRYTEDRAVVDITLLNLAAEHVYDGDGQSGLGLWGAQFERGRLGIYFPTPPGAPGSAPGAPANATTPALPPGTGVNLLQPSENFADTRWAPDGATVEATAAAPPSGTGKTQRLVEADTPGRHRIEARVSALTPGKIHTFSVYVRPEQRTAVVLEARDQDPTKAYGRATFDLSTKVVSFRSDQIIDARLAPAAGGWYRCWIAIKYDTDRAVVDIGLADRANNGIYLGDGRSGIELWGAQFEGGGAPGVYARTLDGPVAHSR